MKYKNTAYRNTVWQTNLLSKSYYFAEVLSEQVSTVNTFFSIQEWRYTKEENYIFSFIPFYRNFSTSSVKLLIFSMKMSVENLTRICTGGVREGRGRRVGQVSKPC